MFFDRERVDHVFFNCQELKIGYSSVRRDDIPLHFSLSFFDPSPLEEEEEEKEEEEEGPSLEKGGEEGKKGEEAKSGVDGSPFRGGYYREALRECNIILVTICFSKGK